MMDIRKRFFSKTKLANAPRPGMDTPCLEWQASTRDGRYGQIGIRRNNHPKNYSTHRLAWQLEHGEIPDGLCVLHRCDNVICVRADHLFLGTCAVNSADMVAKGRQNTPHGDRHGTKTHPESHAHGEKHVNAKLTEADIPCIFRLRSEGWSQQRIANRFLVSFSLIHLVLCRRRWAHVDLEPRQWAT